MIKYKEEKILKPYALDKQDFIDLEQIVLSGIDLPDKTIPIYDITCEVLNYKVGPENSMEDFIKYEELFDLLSFDNEYFISILYIDNDHHIYLGLSNVGTMLNIKSTDNEWTSAKTDQIIKFLEVRQFKLADEKELIQEEIPANRFVTEKKRITRKKGIKTGFLLILASIILLFATIYLMYNSFYRY